VRAFRHSNANINNVGSYRDSPIRLYDTHTGSSVMKISSFMFA